MQHSLRPAICSCDSFVTPSILYTSEGSGGLVGRMKNSIDTTSLDAGILH